MTAELAFLVATAVYAGFQWCVQVVVYPQFAAVPAESFAAYEAAHQRRITPLVGVVFGLLVVATGWLAFGRDPRTPVTLVVIGAVLVVAVLALTAFAAVPQHRVLSDGWDASAARRLQRVDLARAVVATAAVALGLVMVLGASGTS